MSVGTCFPSWLSVPAPTGKFDLLEEIRALVRLAVTRQRPARAFHSRRHEQRYPFPYPIQLVPLDACESPLPEESCFVIGKHLSELGLDFYHSEPLPHRRVIAWLPASGIERTGLLTELTWCRSNGSGWYENGGRFLRAVQGSSSSSLEAKSLERCAAATTLPSLPTSNNVGRPEIP